jgi:hypothetical protein
MEKLWKIEQNFMNFIIAELYDTQQSLLNARLKKRHLKTAYMHFWACFPKPSSQ